MIKDGKKNCFGFQEKDQTCIQIAAVDRDNCFVYIWNTKHNPLLSSLGYRQNSVNWNISDASDTDGTC